MPCAGKHSCTSSNNNVLKALFVLMPPSIVNKPINYQYLYQRKAKTLFCGKFFKSYLDPCAYLLKWSRYAPVCDTCISNTPSEKLLDRLNLLIIGFNFLVDNLGGCLISHGGLWYVETRADWALDCVGSGRNFVFATSFCCLVIASKKKGVMATFDNWQTKLPTIIERTKFIFNNELLSDIKFIAPVSNSESESRKSQKGIPGHKFVLAISSPVFYAMFYGELAETADIIELPDCDYESLLELFRYLYSDEVNLSGSNVMQVLYLAKKYLVPSLADKCTEYLGKHLEASNVFSILPQAQKFGDKDLEERCWDVIELHTGEAVTSDEFVTLERSLVESVVKKEKLHVKEVDLFKAVDRWASKEVERQGLTFDGEVKREILGEEIVKAIRFPLMSQKDFVSVVFDSDILTKAEISDMMRHFCNVCLRSPLPFINSPRRGFSHRFYRYAVIKPPEPDGRWTYGTEGFANTLTVTFNRPVKLHGVQHFGSEDGVYTVSLKVTDSVSGFSLIEKTGSHYSEKDESNSFYGFDVIFDQPVCLQQGRTYNIVSFIKGPRSWFGEFVKSVDKSVPEIEVSSSPARGQFPSLILNLA